MSTREEAVGGFIEVFADAHLASDVATKLNCTELEALASLLDAVGETVAAQQWRLYHAEDDDEGDLHNPDGSIREAAIEESVEPDDDDLRWAREDLGPDASEDEVHEVAGRRAREAQQERRETP